MTETLTSHELQSLDNAAMQDHVRHSQDDEAVHATDQQLQPVDGGLAAWRVLLAAFMFEAILWGLPMSFGIFQEYYSDLPAFAGSPYITYVGSIATGIVYLGAPLLAPLVKRFPVYQSHMVWLGWVICIAALIAGSFANTVGALVVTQGVLYGTGYLIIFYPLVSIVNEWWVARRGLAWGILLASSGASGIAYPFINETLLHRYGYKTTLRAIAVGTIILTAPLLPFVKRRLPASHSAALVKTDWAFVGKPIFWLYMLSTITQSLGFYLPSLYLPTYASAIGLSPKTGAVLLAVMNVASVMGQFTYGSLSDGRLPLNILLISTTTVAAIASLTVWGFAKSLAILVVFVLIYGFFAYAYMAMRVRMGTAVASEQSDAMTIFCLFSFAQGIGNVLAGPISGALLDPVTDVHEYGYNRYKALVIFTGLSMVASTAFTGLSCFAPSKIKH